MLCVKLLRRDSRDVTHAQLPHRQTSLPTIQLLEVLQRRGHVWCCRHTIQRRTALFCSMALKGGCQSTFRRLPMRAFINSSTLADLMPERATANRPYPRPTEPTGRTRTALQRTGARSGSCSTYPRNIALCGLRNTLPFDPEQATAAFPATKLCNLLLGRGQNGKSKQAFVPGPKPLGNTEKEKAKGLPLSQMGCSLCLFGAQKTRAALPQTLDTPK